jgi:hypothetical protein
LWPAGRAYPISRGNTGGGMDAWSAGERATAAVTRYGCWRGEPFEGQGATGKENAGRESSSLIINGARGCASQGKDHGNVARVRTSLRRGNCGNAGPEPGRAATCARGPRWGRSAGRGSADGATCLQLHDPARPVQVCHGWRARACSSVRKGRGRRRCDGNIAEPEARHRVLIPVGLSKRGEPQYRLQDATSLRVDARRKPSKPGGTARAERVQTVAGLSRRSCASSPKSDREWTRADCVDGGAILGQPQERSPDEVGFERVKATCKVAFTPSPMKATNGL